jgi:hypothetical protein
LPADAGAEPVDNRAQFRRGFADEGLRSFPHDQALDLLGQGVDLGGLEAYAGLRLVRGLMVEGAGIDVDGEK